MHTFKVKVIALFLVGFCAFANCQSGQSANIQDDNEVLVWHPGSNIPPRPTIFIERFKNNDLGIAGTDHFGQHAAFGSVMEYFCGSDPELRKNFVETFMKYHVDKHNMLYPGYPVPENPNCFIYTYRAPYEFDQPAFQQWLQKYTKKNDIVEPKGRESNPYRGPVVHPWANGRESIDDSYLKKTFGHAVYQDGNSVVLLNDNRFNPLRWVGPLNEVHHHEQPAMTFMMRSGKNKWEQTSNIFRDFLNGSTDKRILLEYDIELSVDDFRSAMAEKTIWDFYRGYGPIENPSGVLSQTHRNAWLACMGQAFGGKTFSPEQRLFNLDWIENRIINYNIQCSIAVNFKERDNVYRLMEYMICGKHQTAHLWNTTPAEVLNSYAVDGGANDTHGWYRASIEMLRDERFTDAKSSSHPVLIQADPYIEVPEGGGLKPTRVKGVIDLTRYYEISRKLGCFPGQKSKQGDQWLGFEGSDPQKANRNESHGIEWVGVVFENHGPFRVQIKINKLNVRVVPG